MSRLTLIAAIATLLCGCNLYSELDRPEGEITPDLGNNSTQMDAGVDVGEEPDAAEEPDLGADAAEMGIPGCVSQTDLDFCNTNQVDCDQFVGFDNCERSRTVNCGMCQAGTTCGEQAPNVCGCPCSIDGTCVGIGAINPDDSCLVCDPARNAQGWSLEDRPECSVFPVGETLRIDLGPTTVGGWTTLENDTQTDRITTIEGTTTTAKASATGFSGEQTGGPAMTDLGWPREVVSDTLWVGSFDGHAAALPLEALVSFEGLPDGTYELRLFASRNGDDGGIGRLTRYTVQGVTQDLEVSDNTTTLVTFMDLVVDNGMIEISVRVSPDGTARFGYLGALEVQRTQ